MLTAEWGGNWDPLGEGRLKKEEKDGEKSRRHLGEDGGQETGRDKLESWRRK